MPKKEDAADNVRLQFSGLEHVREVRRSDLGVFPESDEVLTWSRDNNFICPVELTPQEVQVLAGSGGSWAVVTEESSTAPEEEQAEIELPTVTVPSGDASTDDQASDQADL
jgi:hypothetical protein